MTIYPGRIYGRVGQLGATAVSVALTAAQTATLAPGRYRFKTVVALVSGRIVTIASGWADVS